MIGDLRNFATTVEPEEKLSVVQADESDNRYLEFAIESVANYVVTGDRICWRVKEYQGILVITLAAFLALLEAEE